MEKVDRRVQRTQQLLGDALIALSVEKGYEHVTIRDITERANVAYITFFRHYEDRQELLAQRVQQVVSELETLAGNLAEADTAAFHETEGRLIFEHVQRQPDLYRVMVSSAVRKDVQKLLANGIQAHFEQHDLTISREIAAHHCSVSLLGLIEWWLDNSMTPSPEEMAQIYQQIIIQPLLTFQV